MSFTNDRRNLERLAGEEEKKKSGEKKSHRPYEGEEEVGEKTINI